MYALLAGPLLAQDLGQPAGRFVDVGALRAGARGYDLIVVGDYLIPRFQSLNLIEPVPPGTLKNLDNLAPRFRRPAILPPPHIAEPGPAPEQRPAADLADRLAIPCAGVKNHLAWQMQR